MALRYALVLLALPLVAAAAPDFDWAETYDGGGLYTDEGLAALVHPDGDLILGGVSHDGVDGLDLLVCRLDQDTGGILWETRESSFDPLNDMALSEMCWDGLGDLLVAGYVVGCVG